LIYSPTLGFPDIPEAPDDPRGYGTFPSSISNSSSQSKSVSIEYTGIPEVGWYLPYSISNDVYLLSADTFLGLFLLIYSFTIDWISEPDPTLAYDTYGLVVAFGFNLAAEAIYTS